MILKKGQEEMIGFVLIIILVSIIVLVFLGFSLRNSNKVEIKSYEVESFIQSALQTTSDCEDSGGFLSVKDLILSCEDGEKCLNERDTCEVRDETLEKICEEAWKVEEDAPIKGYELRIILDGREIFLLEEGNVTQNSRGASYPLPKRSRTYDVSFNIYYS